MVRPVEKVTVTCTGCGVRLERLPSQVARSITGRFFCSPECRNAVGSKPRTVPDRTCEHCGRTFHRPSNRMADRARWCSKECRSAAALRTSTCEQCGREFTMPAGKMRLRSGRYCSKRCLGLSNVRRGVGREHNDKPVLLDNNGYLKIWEPNHPDAHGDGWMLEHRYVAALNLGRRLRADEQVHHINGDKTDNRPENLAVLDPVGHTLITVDERGLRRAAAQRRIRDLEAELARYRDRYGPLD